VGGFRGGKAPRPTTEPARRADLSGSCGPFRVGPSGPELAPHPTPIQEGPLPIAASPIVVVGGGIAGLATAWRIRERARVRGVATEVIVLEREQDPGGKVISVANEGWVFEGGPTGFLDNEAATLRLVHDLGIDGDLIRSRDAARRRFVVRNDRLFELSVHPLKFLTSPLLSLRGRLRAVAEWWQPARRGGGEESVAAFGQRRLGPEFTDVLLDSMVSGIHAGDPAQLSLQAAFPKVAHLEEQFGGLLRGMRALKRKRQGQADAGPGGVLHSFRGGMARPIQALVAALGPDSVRTGCRVRSVAREGQDHVVRYEDKSGRGSVVARSVVVATPARPAAEILRDRVPDAAGALEGIPTAGVHVVCAGYRREQVDHPLEGFGALIPHREGKRILGTLWSSSTFDGYAPEDHVQLRTLLGGARRPEANDLSDDELVDLVSAETRSLYGISGDPVRLQVFRWPRGIPQYVLGHLDRKARIDAALLRCPGLFLTGNSVCGISFNHCVADSERVAADVVDHVFGT
jgi:oxygen-dependent protoporphyrinogen oxidase